MKRGQTISILHLVELLMVIFALTALVVGLADMVNGLSYFQQIYAKDNAYVIDALQAVPNGAVDLGYLWDAPNYRLSVESAQILVSKQNTFLGRDTTIGKTKAYSQSTFLTVEPRSLTPKYYRVQLRGDEQKTILFSETLAPPSCPDKPVPNAIEAAEYPSASRWSVERSVLPQIITEVRSLSAAQLGGVRVALVWENSAQPTIRVATKTKSQTTDRIVCFATRSDTTLQEVPLSEIPLDAQALNTDIIIHVSASPQERQDVVRTIAAALAPAWRQS